MTADFVLITKTDIGESGTVGDADGCVIECNAWGGPSVTIWGGIGFNKRVGHILFQNVGIDRGNRVTAQRYIDQVVSPKKFLFFFVVI